ncbi:MAG: FtsX-like permease family protein [Clostridiales bacterium]|nr:FtsX-like permease family protein [Clostridiales bacterium]
MNIVLKNSLKNIFGKPFRTLLVVFAIFVCSLCALFCFDLSDSITKVLTNFMGSISRADFILMGNGSDVSVLPDGFPEADTMKIIGNSEMLYKPIEGEYCYVTTESLRIFGLDVDEAVDMEFMAPIDIKDGEMYVTRTFAETYGYEVGDKITIHDRAKDEVELTIGGLLPDDNKNPLIYGNTAIVNLNTSDTISCGYREADIIMIDLKDNTMIEDAKKMLEEKYPDASITDLFLTDSDMAMVGELKAVFYMLFAITFLLVIFVTASICNRIVSERMSYIGTLRSLGMSTSRTGRILLLENVLYAVLGSIPATVLYSFIRGPILDLLFFTDDGTGNSIPIEIPPYPAALVAGVIIGAVLIECLIPLKAILKALKTSVRDIIFDNRDTAYRFSKSTFIFGLVCLAIAIVTFIFKKNLILATLCLVSSVAALAFLFPRILKLVTALIRKIADKSENASWSIAAVEAISRKSTVGSGVLCATAAAMCIVVYSVSGALTDSVSDIPYDCDVVAETSDSYKYYTYIDDLEGVNDVEFVYRTMQEFSIGDEEMTTIAYFYGLPDGGYEHFSGFKDLPATLEEGSVIVDKKYANRKGLSEGDTIKITINPLSVLPFEREYKIAKITEGNSYDGGLEALIVNQNEFKALFHDNPGMALIKCEDPDAVKTLLETYGKGKYASVDTFADIVEQQNSDNAKTVAVVSAILVIALGMTAIGMISNQLLGFEGRKKECAVMLSTAMGKGKLSGILLKEVFITSVSASGVGVLVGTLLSFVIDSAMANAQSVVMEVTIDPLTVLFFFAAMTLVFTGTVLFPLKNLRKMKIAEQIKYE